ncbi:MAG: GH25 family lysozyme [Lachnospiraceae bacterium]|nr:GH25 family lysozyme [Lachnospiraceae bacterium]
MVNMTGDRENFDETKEYTIETALDETQAFEEEQERLRALEEKKHLEEERAEALEYDDLPDGDYLDDDDPDTVDYLDDDDETADPAAGSDDSETADYPAGSDDSEAADHPDGDAEDTPESRVKAAKSSSTDGVNDPSVQAGSPKETAGEISSAGETEPEESLPDSTADEMDEDDSAYEDRVLSAPGSHKSRILDFAVILAGAAVAAALVFAGRTYFENRAVSQVVGTYAALGTQFPAEGSIGTNIISSIAGEKKKDLEEKEAAEEAAKLEAEKEKEELLKNRTVVEVRLTSILQDLKIKFVNKDSNSLIDGVSFRCTVAYPDGTTKEYEDDDLDGIVYLSGLKAGTYTVTCIPFEKTDEDYLYYKLSEEPQSIAVKDQIEYKKVDVTDEIKDTSQVNVAREDTGHAKKIVEPVTTDTVEWVESTKTEVSDSEDGYYSDEASYEEVSRDNVPDPSGSASLPRITGNPYADGRMLAKAGEVRLLGMVASVSPVRIALFADNDGGETSDAAVTSREASSEASSDSSSESSSSAPSGVTGVSIDGGSQSVRSASVKLHATVSADGVNVTYTWEVTDGSAGISGSGADATLTFTDGQSSDAAVKVTAAGDDGSSASAEATISYNAAQSTAVITVIPTSVNLTVGSSVTLRVSVQNSDGGKLNDQSVTYSSSDSSVATVDSSGKISAVSAGSCTVTVARSSDSSVSADVAITVASNSTSLKDKDGNQLYVKKSDGTYRAATGDDYYDTSVTLYKLVSGRKKYRYTGWQTLEGKTYFFDKNGNYVTGTQTIQGVEYTFGSDGALAVSGSGTLGIDVSQWNGSIDWNAVKNAGVSFVIIRCGFRGSATGALVRDSNFKTNIAGAKAAGLKVGVYFYTQAINEVEAVEEASMALSLVSGYSLDYPIYLDIESSGGRGDSISYDERTNVAKAFCATVKASGYRAGVYANTSWMSGKFNAGSLSSYSIWLAQYAASPTYSSRYDIWQYSSAGHINGISGYVDLNKVN